ncbi:MAG TPA: amino acid adenylation domain-containing protein [Bryobacteraceae bacterium]|jgi:amino acid adenylation domain-containing protein|nr:amino acid adenylation domain-containing protein [Bryobacteraceae bacterium]
MPPLKDDIEDILLLSPMQERMLFRAAAEPESRCYYVQTSCRVEGDLDVSALRQAWEMILERHSALRLGFAWKDRPHPLQVIFRSLALRWHEEDWRRISTPAQEERFAQFLESDAAYSFNLAKPPLFRVSVLRLTDEAAWIVFRYHHLILDGWSAPLLWNEVIEIYRALRGGVPPALDCPVPFSSFIDWLQTARREDAESFWRSEFMDFESAPSLSAGLKSRPVISAPFAARELRFSAETTARLKSFAREQGVSLGVLLHGAWSLLVARHTGKSESLFGSVVSCRPAAVRRSENMIGNIINTIPLRVVNPRNWCVGEWLRNLGAKQARAQEYAYCGLSEIQRWTGLADKLFLESIVVVENYPLRAVRDKNAVLAITEVRTHEVTDLPLTVVADTSEELALKLSFDTSRFHPPEIERMLRRLEFLCERLLSPERRLAEISSLTVDEHDEFLVRWNQTEHFAELQSAAKTFSAQAIARPDALAVSCGEEQICYRELEDLSNQIAWKLLEFKVGPEVIVGLYFERSIALVAAILGVWKAGGAWVPIDPTSPSEYIQRIIDDSKPAVLLANQRLDGPTQSVPCICTDDCRSASIKLPPNSTCKGNLAYILYTSGSTGQSKGVMITHEGLSNYLAWAIQAYRTPEPGGAPVHSPIGFDLTLTSLLVPLLDGRPIMLLPTLPGVKALCDALTTEGRPNLLKITPAHLELLNAAISRDALSRLSPAVVIGGEALSAEALTRWRTEAPRARLFNEYGPTETVVGCCVYEIGRDTPATGSIPVGRPIINTRLYVLDQWMDPVPPGTTGELYIGGAGVARGYLGKPGLTAQTFVPDPFGPPGARLYRSGDWVRHLEDRNLEYLGRRDRQVKVRGYRIEPSEIEAALLRNRAVRECVVSAIRDENCGSRLVAWWTATEIAPPRASELRAFLHALLPPYMIPAAFVQLPAMPLDKNGKVDRNRLPLPDSAPREIFDLPGAGRERVIARVWAEVLNVESVGLRENFFDLGGNSLLLLRLSTRLRDSGICDIPVIEMFRYPTVEALASALNTANPLASGNGNSGNVEFAPVGASATGYEVVPGLV